MCSAQHLFALPLGGIPPHLNPEPLVLVLGPALDPQDEVAVPEDLLGEIGHIVAAQREWAIQRLLGAHEDGRVVDAADPLAALARVDVAHLAVAPKPTEVLVQGNLLPEQVVFLEGDVTAGLWESI